MYEHLFNIYKNEYGDIAKKVFDKHKQLYPAGASIQSYGFIVTFLNIFYKKDFDEEGLSRIITDCSSDGGIDAIYFGKKSLDLFDFKEKGGVSDVDIDRITLSLIKYFKQGSSDFTGEEAIKEHILKIRRSKPRPIRLFFVREKGYSIEQLKDGSKGSPKIKKQIETIESLSIQVCFIDIEGLFKKDMKEESVTGSIVLKIDKDLNATNQQGFKEIIAIISLKTLMKELVGKYGNKVISSNIRNYLNKKTFSNKIIETIKTDPRKFWIYHNGITITCSKLCPMTPNLGSISIENPQVVNGAQTLFGLQKAYEDKMIDDSILKKGSLICKIIEADNEFSKKICETSNTQNAVKTEDLVSNEEINLFLERFIYRKSSGKFIYNRKKTNLKNSITSVKFFQWAYSAFLKKPAAAKNDKQFLFDIVTQKGKFKQIENAIKRNLESVVSLCEIGTYVGEMINAQKSNSSLLRHMDMHIIAALCSINDNKGEKFNEIFDFLKRYADNCIKNTKQDSLNYNKIFTKTEGAWSELQKYLKKYEKRL